VRHGIGAKLALAVLLFTSGAATTSVAHAQTPAEPSTPTSSVPAGSNLLNPNVSVIGWFQAEAGDRSDEPGTQTFALREAELGIQANVDPYSRADFFISVSPEEGIDLEEGYITLLTLPAGLSAKLGKFRNNFGKFNRTHPPETPFADRPLAAERFLGEEGLAGAGASISWLIPVPVYLNLDAEVTNTPDREEVPSFEAFRGKDLLYTSRLSTFLDVGESVNFTLGASLANGANGAALADTDFVTPDPKALRATLVGADVTFRWKNPRRAIYRSLIAQVEWMQRHAEEFGGPDRVGNGGFAYVDYQFARRWHAGLRLDMSESLDGGPYDRGQLGFLTFTPSEFSLVSAQVRRLDTGGSDETTYFLKTTFNIGPHGQHPF
jgi:hypothetical protein